MPSQGNALGAALEAALVRELLETWRRANESYFRGALRAPVLEMVSARSTLGRWLSATRTLEISRELVLDQPWGAVVEVLKHEMAHQYVDEVLRERDQTPHGKAFQEACARMGVDARASGVPEIPGGGDPAAERVLERVRKLLALAESPNRHEAEAAMAAAQRLMLRHNLDAVRASGPRSYAFAHLGAPTGRVAEHERLVAVILGKHFFVETIWVPVYRPREAKRGSVLEVLGSPENLAIAEYVHGFLLATAERLWRDHKRARAIRADRERRAYLSGVMVGFADKLARQEARTEGEGLVWVPDAVLPRYLRQRHPHVRHVRHTGPRRSEAWAHGRKAGRDIVLHRPVAEPASARGHLLRGKS